MLLVMVVQRDDRAADGEVRGGGGDQGHLHRPVGAAVPTLVMLIIGWMVSPGCMVGGTPNAEASSPGGHGRRAGPGSALTLFQRSDSSAELVELTIRWT